MFDAHGEYAMTLSQRVFCVKCSGLWNQETMQKYAEDSFRTAQPLFGQPWGMLSDITDWELATPDCEPILIWLLKKGVENGLSREAVVNNSGTIKLRQFNVSLPEDTPGFIRQFFDNRDDALAWLALEGFPVDPELSDNP